MGAPESIFQLTNQEIFVVTAAHNGQLGGQVATWVMLATLIPERLRVIIAISPFNYTQSLLQQSQRFVLNLLAAGQEDWLVLFGLHSGRDINKFSEIDFTLSPTGIPILPQTCGWAECVIGQSVNLGDRILYIADVVEHRVYPERTPMREVAAFATLPEDVRQALASKLEADIERSRGLIRSLSSFT
ncbi:MAG: flavin reductase family protein [Aphanocapsa sp. GSE-SYN-MK-11-07L]|jgi:flavin reductase (DIM6/NTAB) family NADH-FMN oxidoreductase RutF|nr:flavin reductase family protein [Aphanocapsa sp. GSE-SYN-MK-11-07L]